MRKVKLKVDQRVEDASGNKGRILHIDLRRDIVRVRMDGHLTNRDYNITLLKPASHNGTRND